MNDTIYRIDSNIIWKDVDDAIYILQPEREEIHALNDTGSFIWRLINKGHTPGQIKKEMLMNYKVPLGRASKDIQEFIDRYVGEKFLIPEKNSRKK